MFDSAVKRLTLWYLSILMVISFCFSLVLYRVLTNELETGLRRQAVTLRHIPNDPDIFQMPNLNEIEKLRQQQLDESKQRVQLQLLYFNLILLALGGIASYNLALQTLRPIEESLEAQSRFTADASHELRTPLTSMKTEIEVALRDKNPAKSDLVGLLKSNLEEIDKLEALSNGLLKLAKHQNGEAQLHFQDCSVAELVETAVGRVGKIAAKHGNEIVKDVNDGTFKGDKQSLVELLVILLDNALKYGPDGSPVAVRAGIEGRHAVFSVKDEGVGIKASDLPRIFDRFYRSDTSRSKRSADGYGLGLSIAKQIADAHRGTIKVESSPGKGSLFTVSLPVAPGHAAGL